MIQIKDLAKSYKMVSDDTQQDIRILNQLNLTVQTGETVAIVGASGSGKSTLLGLVSGLDQPDSGEVIINNQSLQKLNQQDVTGFRASNIAIVFQQYYLVQHLTALENVLLPLEILNQKVDETFVKNLLDQVGLSHRIHHKPNQLSGGESQRLALARALVIKPSLLLADEPSGSLDVDTGQKIMSLFFDQVKKNKTTTVLVTHDPSLAKKCDRVFQLTNGQLQVLA